MLSLLLSVLVVGAMGQATGPAASCRCVSHQFTSMVGVIGGMVLDGQATPIDMYEAISYDYDNKKIAVTTYTTDPTTGKEIQTSILDNYNDNKRYMQSADGCFYSTLVAPLIEPCIPANATFLATVNFGAGQNLLKADVWSFTMPGESGTLVEVKVVLSATDCTPIAEAIYGNALGAGGPIAQTLFFTNYQPSVANATVFSVPANCQPLPTQAPNNPGVGRRSVFF